MTLDGVKRVLGGSRRREKAHGHIEIPDGGDKRLTGAPGSSEDPEAEGEKAPERRRVFGEWQAPGKRAIAKRDVFGTVHQVVECESPEVATQWDATLWRRSK